MIFVSIRPDWFGDDFVQVHPDAVRYFDGDVLAVYVLARIRFRTRVPFGYERDGRRWWRSSATELAEDLGLSVDRVRRTIRSLVARGALDAEKHHAEGPYDQTLSYAVVYSAATDVADSPDRGSASPESDVVPAPDVHVADSPDVPIRSEEPKEVLLASRADRFSDFWDIYPRRVGRAAARKAWDRAVLTASSDVIIDGARTYASSPLPEPRFIPHPATWLSQRRWEDELPARSSVPAVGPGRGPRCQVYGHEGYSATNCAGCRADALTAGVAC